MIRKLPIGKVTLLVDKGFSMQQLCNQLNSMGKQMKVRFIEQQAGAGFLQWTVQGEGWASFVELDDTLKPVAANVYQERCAAMRKALEGFPLVDDIMTVPSENEFVFFRQVDNDWEIALAAWGYKYTDLPTGNEISVWFNRNETQEVNISFSFNGEMLCDAPFLLDGFPRNTASDGYFRPGKPLPVGTNFMLKACGQQFPMTVEKGKSDYVFDIKHYAKVEITVTNDGTAQVGQQCVVSFNGSEYQVQTDETGLAVLEMPLATLQDGTLQKKQPECRVACNQEVQSQTPTVDGGTLCFNFAFVTEAPPVVEPDPKMLKISMLDKDGKPLKDLPIKLRRANAEDLEGRTDADGNVFFPASLFTVGETVKVVCSYKGRMKLKMQKPDK